MVSDIDLLRGAKNYQEVKSKAFETVRGNLKDGEIVKKIEDNIFPEIKKRLVEKIEKYVKNPKQRKILSQKVAAIEWDGTSCFGGEQVQNLPLFLEPNAYYNPQFNTFRICSGLLLNNNSEFQIANVIAHELAHAIDPCGVTVGPEDFRFQYSENATQEMAEAEYPFANIISCLRKDTSIKARRFQGSSVNPYSFPYPNPYPNPAPKFQNEKVPNKGDFEKNKADGQGYGSLPIEGVGSSSAPSFTGFCHNQDQITEAVPDWLASEILPEYIADRQDKLSLEQLEYGYSNVWRGMCDSNNKKQTENQYYGGAVFDVHSDLELRIDAVLLVQPKVRQQLGCASKHAKFEYCEINNKSNLSLEKDVEQVKEGQAQ